MRQNGGFCASKRMCIRIFIDTIKKQKNNGVLYEKMDYVLYNIDYESNNSCRSGKKFF
jgi:hypothetical protein